MALQAQAIEEVNVKNRVWFPVLVLVGVLAIIGLWALLRRGPVPIRYAKVARGAISANISTNGKVEPAQNFEAHAPAATSVKRVLVNQGDKVKAGQLLLELDDSGARAEAARAEAQVKAAQADLDAIRAGGTREEVATNQADLTRAQAELQAAQRNLTAMQRLQQTGAASPAEVQDAESRLKNAQTQVNLLQQKTGSRFAPQDVQRAESNLEQARAAYSATQDVLAKSNIRAPQAGEVYSLPVRAGNFVNAGDLVVQVADLSKLIVRAFVDEPDIGRLSKGQPVNVTWDAVPGRTWVGTVTQVPTTVTTRGSRSVGEVTAEVDNSDRKLLPNVNVSVTIVSARHENALIAPREAVHQGEGQRYVLQVVDGKITRKDVETSIANLTQIEITKGLQEGATVALSAYNNQPLREGTRVSTQ
jgi:HlyD family secretion protein